MRISGQFGQGRPVLSFEFFPPRTEKGYDSLYRTIAALRPLQPSFVSVTWGAGGTTRRKTVELVSQIETELGITAMAHMTTVGSDRAEITEVFDRLQNAGIQNLLALPWRNRPLDPYEPGSAGQILQHPLDRHFREDSSQIAHHRRRVLDLTRIGIQRIGGQVGRQ